MSVSVPLEYAVYIAFAGDKGRVRSCFGSQGKIRTYFRESWHSQCRPGAKEWLVELHSISVFARLQEREGGKLRTMPKNGANLGDNAESAIVADVKCEGE